MPLLSFAENSKRKDRNIISKTKADKCTVSIQIRSLQWGKWNIRLYFRKSIAEKKNRFFCTKSIPKFDKWEANDWTNILSQPKRVAMLFIKYPKFCLRIPDTNRYLQTQKCFMDCCLTVCSYPSKTVGRTAVAEVYQYFTVKQAQKLLGFGHEKICKLFHELEQSDLTASLRKIKLKN